VCLKYDDSTFENSLEGDMTKLSLVLAQEMRCWMLWSSSMLYSLCIKAVWTTLGCCAAAAAPTAGAWLPLGDVLPESPFPSLCDWDWKELVPLRSEGGPMVDEVGVMSMGSLGGASVEPDEGRMGIDLWRLGLCGSAEKGLRRASATEAMALGSSVESRRRGEMARGRWMQRFS